MATRTNVLSDGKIPGLSRRRIAGALVLIAIAWAGCGEDGSPARTDRPATSPAVADTPSPTATPTPSPAPSSSPETPANHQPESDPGEGGDEAGNRVPVELELAVEEVLPARVEVPAFLALRVTVRNESGGERNLRLGGRTILEILPGATERIDLEGLQPGEHVIDAGESGRATIVARRAG